MKYIASYQNFARGKIDHDLMGRFDLPIYNTGSDIFRNFISNFHGNAIYRPGFWFIYDFEDCAFVPFKFSNNQNYLMAWYNTKIRFLSFDSNNDIGWVLSGMSPLEVSTPYSLADSKLLQTTQNADVMIVTRQGYPPYQLKRTSATSFTFLPFPIKDNPFVTTLAASKTITAITKATSAQVTATGHGYSVGDVVKISGVVGMTQINNYTVAVATVVDADNFTINLDTSTFTAYTSGGIAEKVTAGVYPQCCLFYKGRLYFANSSTRTTRLWGSEAGNYNIFTVPTTPTATSGIQVDIAEISQPIDWLFGGENSLIAGSAGGIVAINGGGVGEGITAETIEANLTAAERANSTYPLAKDSYVFYAGLTGRNLNFFSYDLLTESFKSEDANFVSYDITKGGITKLEYKKDKNDLIFALLGTGKLLSMNFNAGEKIVGWHEYETEGTFEQIGVITDNNGNPKLFALVKRGSDYFIEQQADFVEFSERSNFYTGRDKEETDLLAYKRKVAEELKDCCYLDAAVEFSDSYTSTITYDSGAGTITSSASNFTAGDVGKQIVYRTQTGYEYGRFEITGYTSGTVVSVDVLQTPSGTTSSDWYKTFSTISGLNHLNGMTVSVVADGGYLDDFTVTANAIDLETSVTHVVIGYSYRGVIKSFSLGFQARGDNTQVTMKNITAASLRLVASMGGLLGSSQYNLEPVQELQQDDVNYLPPVPIDGTKDIQYTDDAQQDKYMYVVQEEPAPFQIAAVMLEAYYTVRF